MSDASDDVKQTFLDRFNREFDEANASMDRKERELDEHGYGGDPSKPRGQVVGLDHAGLTKDETSPGFPRLGRRIDSLPIQRTFSIEGRWRVYFNRHGAEPLMWCISPDAGGFELAACNVQISATSTTVYRKKETADEDDGRPSAWIAVEGLLTVSLTGDVTIGALNDR